MRSDRCSLSEMSDAFLSGYYHVAGGDAWYEDHDDNGLIKKESNGDKALRDYLQELETEWAIEQNGCAKCVE